MVSLFLDKNAWSCTWTMHYSYIMTEQNSRPTFSHLHLHSKWTAWTKQIWQVICLLNHSWIYLQVHDADTLHIYNTMIGLWMWWSHKVMESYSMVASISTQLFHANQDSPSKLALFMPTFSPYPSKSFQSMYLFKCPWNVIAHTSPTSSGSSFYLPTLGTRRCAFT